MMTKKLNLMKMKSRTFLGDSMMRTLKGWFLYKKTFYAICNTRQESPPATWQPIDDGFSVMQGWWQTLVMWKDTWPCTAMQVLCLWPRKVTWKDMELSCTTQMVLPTSCLWTMLRRKTRWLLIANLMTVCKLSNWANTQASKGSRKIWGHNIHKNAGQNLEDQMNEDYESQANEDDVSQVNTEQKSHRHYTLRKQWRIRRGSGQ